ncbi:MAG: glutathione peroxidase, partial [Chitinophagaceae bacterium]
MYRLLIILMFFSCAHRESPKMAEIKTHNMNNSIHQFKIASLTGGIIDLSSFKGKKILVVNTASECGYTPQYAGLQELSEKYSSRLVVVGFPSNDFGGQEPGSSQEIQTFCKKNFGVTFPLTEKVTVKGRDAHPIYQWLTSKEKNGVLDSEV